MIETDRYPIMPVTGIHDQVHWSRVMDAGVVLPLARDTVARSGQIARRVL
jgi:hypothetical protein